MRKSLMILGTGILLASGACLGGEAGFGSLDPNPALVGFSGESRVDFISLRASAGNNSFSIGEYSLYNGKFLTGADKARIMGSVPESGLDTRAHVSVGGGASWNRGIRLVGWLRAGQVSRMPRDVLDLALFGNEPGRTYDLNGASGEAMGLAGMSIAYAGAVGFSGREVFLGAGLNLLKGLAYDGVVRAEGFIHTGEEGITSAGELVTRTSEGGTGYSLDIGLACISYYDITISTYVLNVASAMHWTSGCVEETNRLIIDSASLGSSDPDSLIEDFYERKTLESFESSISPIAGIRLERDMGWALVSLGYSQGLGPDAFTSGNPRVAASGTWASVRLVDLRADVAYEAGFGLEESVEVGFGRRPRLEFGAGFSPLPYASSIRQVAVSLGLSYRP
jgi:hypothetical protein